MFLGVSGLLCFNFMLFLREIPVNSVNHDQTLRYWPILFAYMYLSAIQTQMFVEYTTQNLLSIKTLKSCK